MYIEILFYLLVGLLFGSFYNVIAMRSLDGRDWVSGRSECDSCHHVLSMIDLIPFFSYLFLGGKCRYCGSKIPIQHFLSEVIFSLILIILRPNLELFIILSVLWINLITDIMSRVTITNIIYVGILFDILYKFFVIQVDIISIIPIICIIIGLFILNIVFKGKDTKFGLGDLDILLLICVYRGIIHSLYVLCFGCILGTLFVIPLLFLKKINRKSEIPLVPFIFLSFILGEILFYVLY